MQSNHLNKFKSLYIKRQCREKSVTLFHTRFFALGLNKINIGQQTSFAKCRSHHINHNILSILILLLMGRILLHPLSKFPAVLTVYNNDFFF